MQVQELVNQRIKLNEDCKGIWEKADKEKRGLTTEERDSVKKMQGEIDTLRGKIEAIATQAEEDRELRASFEREARELGESRGRKTTTQTRDEGVAKASEDEQELAFRGWAMGRHATAAMRAAAQKCGVDVGAPYIDMGVRIRTKDGVQVRTFVPVVCNRDQEITEWRGASEQRALSVGTTTAGGNAVSNEMMRAFYEVQKWYGRFADSAFNVTTETGSTLPWPTVTDTANTGRILAEATTATTTTDPTFGVVNLGAFKFSSDAVLVSWELLQDAFFDIAGYLGMALGRRVARVKQTKFTVGAGTTEPKGVITAATTGVTAGSTTAFVADDLISLVHKLDPAYRSMPGAQFMLHDLVAAAVRKFKDGQGRYLWEMSLQAGMPDRLLGFDVQINNDMDSAFTTGKKLVCFGNWGPQGTQAYVVRNAGAVRFVRADELKVLEHQVVFEASQRCDGNLVDATAAQLLVLA